MTNPEHAEKIKAALPQYLTFFSKLKNDPRLYTDSFNKAAAEDPELIGLVNKSLHTAVRDLVPHYFMIEPIEEEFLSHLFAPTEFIPTHEELLDKLVEYHTWVGENTPSDQQQEQLNKMITLIGFVTTLVSQGQSHIIKWFAQYDQEGKLINRGDLVTSSMLAGYLSEIQVALLLYRKNYLKPASN